MTQTPIPMPTESISIKVLRYTAVIAVILVAFLFGRGYADIGHQKEMAEMLEHIEITHTELETARNKMNSLDTALNRAGEEKQELLEIIADIKEKPAEIRYIVRTETVVEPAVPEVIVQEIEDHEFVLQEDLVIAEIENREEGYALITHELNLKADLVISEDKSGLIVQGSTSANPDHWEDIPVELEVREIREHKVFEPNIGMGMTIVYPDAAVHPVVTASFVHPTPDLDLATVRLGSDGKTASLGVDIASYNLGSQVPVITDLWVGAGVGFNTNLQLQAGLTISTKF